MRNSSRDFESEIALSLRLGHDDRNHSAAASKPIAARLLATGINHRFGAARLRAVCPRRRTQADRVYRRGRCRLAGSGAR